MGEGNIFSLFTLGGGGVPHLRSGVGGYPISGLRWGVPHLRSGVGGVPHLRSEVGGYPISGQGIPQPGVGEVPHPRSGVGGTLARSRWWGVPQVPPSS